MQGRWRTRIQPKVGSATAKSASQSLAVRMSSPEQRCVELARTQYGLITRAQALDCGMGRGAIRHRLESGRWQQVHRGVYRIAGLPESWHHRLLAGCLLGGPGSAASHRSAGELWELDAVPAGFLEITTARQIDRPPLIAHRTPLVETQITSRRGIPVTDPSRTLLDLAAVLREKDVERAFESALRRSLTDIETIVERLRLRGRSGRNGTTAWRRLLAKRDPTLVPTDSDFETLLDQLIERFGLPQPVRQFQIRDGRGQHVKWADFAYPRERVIIEADSIEFHMHSEAFRRDRNQTNELAALGWIVLRFTHWEVVNRPEQVAATIARTLGLVSAAEHPRTHLKLG